MKPKASLPKIVVFLYAFFLAAYLGPPTIAAQENAKKAAEPVAPAHLLDGKQFIGPTGEKGKKVHHEDVLSFGDGRFTSSMCFEFGFTDGPYTATVSGDSIHFQAVTISPTHGKMEWKGTLKGDTLDVTYSWTKERWFWTTFREYWFKGTLKK